MRSRIWIGLHAVVAVLPAIGALARAPDVRLFGAEVPPRLPTPSVDAWRAETLQPAFQAWFEANIGFRGVMVRTDNSAQTDIVGETRPSSAVVRGAEGTLYIKDDVWFMNKRPREIAPALTAIDELSKHLASVQRKAGARGKRVVVVIAPSKTSIYPEAVPKRWRRQSGVRSDVVVHDALVASFARDGVTFADGDALLGAKQGADREVVFARGGRHWTILGACLVLQDALRGSAAMPTCAYETTLAPWAGSNDWNGAVDYDLDRLLNRWRFGSNTIQVPTLIQPSKELVPDHRPRTLFVGTSFIWMLTAALRPFVTAPIAFYYNTTVYDVSETVREIEPVDESSPRWADYALERDLYVIEVLETYAHGEQLLKFVKTLDARFDAVIP